MAFLFKTRKRGSYTRMTDALRATSNFIHVCPERYNFLTASIPSSVYGPGCILGWCAYFWNRNRVIYDYPFYSTRRDQPYPRVQGIDEVCDRLGVPSSPFVFYEKLRNLRAKCYYINDDLQNAVFLPEVIMMLADKIDEGTAWA